MRLLAGLVASRELDVTMIGDASLSRRPMKRIAEPLRLMGASFDGDTPPLRIRGGSLKGIAYASPVASGQIKSCVLLAGLRGDGWTSVTEPSKSRDHTERMLKALGANIYVGHEIGRPDLSQADAFGSDASWAELAARNGVLLMPGRRLKAFEFSVPADISSTAFFLVAGALLPGDGIVARDLNVNPSRTGVLDVLRDAGCLVELRDEREELGEPVADVGLTRGELRAFKIGGALVPRLIDEIPVLAVLATQCEGTTLITDASELRVKESDRLEVMAEGLRRMGARVETFSDGMAINGPTPLTGISIDAKHDHRIAMAFAIAGLVADGTTTIDGAESIATSYPAFMDDLERLIVV
jgi:3-phosphoshikimate 1-carboxyvinyltransferase